MPGHSAPPTCDGRPLENLPPTGGIVMSSTSLLRRLKVLEASLSEPPPSQLYDWSKLPAASLAEIERLAPAIDAAVASAPPKPPGKTAQLEWHRAVWRRMSKSDLSDLLRALEPILPLPENTGVLP